MIDKKTHAFLRKIKRRTQNQVINYEEPRSLEVVGRALAWHAWSLHHLTKHGSALLQGQHLEMKTEGSET